MAMNKFKPLQKDPFIKKEGDQTLAKFGHINAIVDEINSGGGGGGVQSVTGLNVNNTDPLNPVVQVDVSVYIGSLLTGDGTPLNPLNVFLYTDGLTILGDGTFGNPLVAVTSGGGTTYESGTFTLSADGLNATGGTLINPGANPTIRIATSKKLKLGFFTAWITLDPTWSSKGESDGVNQNCWISAYYAISPTTCIGVFGDPKIGAGWEGKVNLVNITDTYFDIVFLQALAGGEAISGQYYF